MEREYGTPVEQVPPWGSFTVNHNLSYSMCDMCLWVRQSVQYVCVCVFTQALDQHFCGQIMGSISVSPILCTICVCG